MPVIEAAIQSGLPPLALIADDPSRTGKYSKWDLKLIKAYYINKAFEVDGRPVWVEESPDIVWTAKSKVMRSAAAVEKEQERIGNMKGSNKHGLRVYAVPNLRPGASWPTRESWAKQREKTYEPDADQKINERNQSAEQRAAAKLAAMQAEESS